MTLESVTWEHASFEYSEEEARGQKPRVASNKALADSADTEKEHACRN